MHATAAAAPAKKKKNPYEQEVQQCLNVTKCCVKSYQKSKTKPVMNHSASSYTYSGTFNMKVEVLI